MRRSTLAVAFSCLLAAPGLADVIPPIEPSTPSARPAGPERASIRGLQVVQVHDDGWRTRIEACPDGTDACGAVGCYVGGVIGDNLVTLLFGNDITGGDIATLIKIEEEASLSDATMAGVEEMEVWLRLESCKVEKLMLPPLP